MRRSKSSRVKWNLALVLAFNLAFGIFDLPSAFSMDKIIAIVNGDAITQKDLKDFLNFMRIQLSREYASDEVDNRIKKMEPELLNKLIEDRLILQEAKKVGIRVDESRIKARIIEIKKGYRNDSEFQEDIAKQGLVQADIEQKIQEQFFMYNVIETKIKDTIVVRPDEITRFYNDNKLDFFTSEERQLDVISLENEDQAKSFAFSLKNGEDLVNLAVRYPISVSKLVTNREEELKAEIKDIVFKLNLNEVSEPVKIDNKFYIFRLNAALPSKQLTLPEAKNKIKNYLFEKKMQDALVKWLDELKTKSYIKIL